MSGSVCIAVTLRTMPSTSSCSCRANRSIRPWKPWPGPGIRTNRHAGVLKIDPNYCRTIPTENIRKLPQHVSDSYDNTPVAPEKPPLDQPAPPWLPYDSQRKLRRQSNRVTKIIRPQFEQKYDPYSAGNIWVQPRRCLLPYSVCMDPNSWRNTR
jgi:hypothetical protein